MELRYGMNPHQGAAEAAPVSQGRWPLRVLNGNPSLINMLDALNGWQLVREARRVLGREVATSFKHVSPAGAATSGPVEDDIAELYGVSAADLSAVAGAYLRARDADPKSSYGDLAAVSEPVDEALAEVLSGLVCDGIIAPGYAPGTVAKLSRKKDGRFLVMEADAGYSPPPRETREVFGLRLTQDRDTAPVTADVLTRAVDGQQLPPRAVADLLLGLVVLRYTQSNSVCYVRDGVTIGIGAGQQSRVDCTRLAGAKADTWWLRRHPSVRAMAFRPEIRRQERINWQIRFIEGGLTGEEATRFAEALSVPAEALTADAHSRWIAGLDGVALASDGALPFRDNVDHARRHGVRYIAEPGGSTRSSEVEQACREHDIVLARTGLRLFHH
ncbi:phosphoribosylaminoimidazolecarboxamide formyltransferase [Actinospica robiniae]|uniref:phosphoribosylaminoimidazolecarboxamide formyltransferase n=1 Tax=Actinospica robiniae TaxID=304901 RepID=UPI0004070B64|nr:phosphoribosylaminoimidazolecarboxamide formyltransferase [Actinospica robiniae]